jgi:hypothetical protein
MQYKSVKKCHVENVVLGKDFNLGTTGSFFHVFTQMHVFIASMDILKDNWNSPLEYVASLFNNSCNTNISQIFFK